MITFTLVGHSEVVAKMGSLSVKLRAAVLRSINRLVLKVQNNVVQNHLSGPTGDHSLSRDTGNLARSVHTSVTQDGGTIVGKIFYTHDTDYAAIHEFGGIIHVPEIVPDKANALAFMMSGKQMILARTKAHDVVMPERAPLRTGFAEMKDTIEQDLQQSLSEAQI